MRHSFLFPDRIRIAVRDYVLNAVSAIPAKQFRQEANYTAALAGKLIGVAYDHKDGRVKFTSTVLDDRAPNSAESKSGADLAIIGSVSDSRRTVNKAVLIQAKRGLIADLPSAELKRLEDQIRDMQKLTRAPKVMEIEDCLGTYAPRIMSGNSVLKKSANVRRVTIQDYLAGRFMTTLDGDTRPDFVRGVSDSSLSSLLMMAEMR